MVSEKKLIYSVRILRLISIACFILGSYFMFLRPSFIMQPEDAAAAHITGQGIKEFNPDLFRWLGYIIFAWGGWIFGMGVLVWGIAANAFKRGERWAWVTLAIAGGMTFITHWLILIAMHAINAYLLGALLVLFSIALILPFRQFFPKR